MGLKPKLRVGWRQLISAASGALSGMFLVTPALSGERAVYVREPRRAEIEYWLRSRK